MTVCRGKEGGSAAATVVIHVKVLLVAAVGGEQLTIGGLAHSGNFL